MKKDKYIISLWEDYLVPAITDAEGKVIIPEHYEEQQIAIIGSDSMTAQWRAVEPKLVENINGTKTFTFKMFYTYIDTENGEKIDNPIINLLVNERKIKVFWKNQWHDLFIKSCQEDTNGKSIVYTCKDQYINELSKTGFNLEFSTELENNQGTIQELAKKTLEGTEWELDEDNSDIIQQEIEEAVYEIILKEPLKIDENITIFEEGQNNTILVYYSVFENKESYFQFHYASEGYTTDINQMLVTNGTSYGIERAIWNGSIVTVNGIEINFTDNPRISNNYRAKRLVRSQESYLDTLTGEYVGVFEHKETKETILGYTKTVYDDPTIVVNLLANTENFTSAAGWLGGGQVQTGLEPELDFENGVPFLKLISEEGVETTYFLNDGISKQIAFLEEGFIKNQKFIYRIKADKNIIPFIGEYSLSEEGLYNPLNENYFSFTSSFENNSADEEGYYQYEVTCNKSISKNSITSSNFGFLIPVTSSLTINDIQFFIQIKNSDGNIIYPGEMEKSSVVSTEYRYFEKQQTKEINNIEDLTYIHIDRFLPDEQITIWPEVRPVYNNNNEKIRSIEIKNSNRFNILQTLAETFQCWIKFEIQHDSNGKIIYNEGRPKKTVRIVKNIGQDTGISFIYGIDLKQISRTINSDQIVTKTIVSPNNNEFATNGFCTIARARDNYPKVNYIYNFDYYGNQGLIDINQINKDLYQSTPDAIGLYFHLNDNNKKYDQTAEILSAKELEKTKQEALLTTYSELVKSQNQEKTDLSNELMGLSGTNSIEEALKYSKDNPNFSNLAVVATTYRSLENQLKQNIIILTGLESKVETLKEDIKSLKEDLKTYQDKIKEVEYQFEKKYAAYIQEGSWLSEEYIDDNLYYYDAKEVSYTSSRPQIQYNISVLRLSALEEFKGKTFNIGDLGYIQDTEYFGYTVKDNYKTPYKEKILISEIVSNFDSPEKDSFKIQNYKTQFEDLFQRITSQTQALQFSSGQYARAASIIEPNGTIKAETLQHSISVNQNLVITSQNELIYQDSTGITLTDATNPNKKVKLTSGGIILSEDGGLTWKTGVRGDGISAQSLSAGAINTNKITIMNGIYPSFRWDGDGINAFAHDPNYGTDSKKFVRFDQYGIYGLTGEEGLKENFIPRQSEDPEDYIREKASFGMTWKGFFLKNSDNQGKLEISNLEDIKITSFSEEKEIERLKIGRISGNSEEGYNYGIRISDDNGIPVLETSDNGSLWLKNRLNIETYNDNQVAIGKLGNTEEDKDNHGSRIIDANNNFVVYEDGHIKALSGEFTGTINATGGQIGGLTIEQLVETRQYVEIISDQNLFVDNNPSEIVLIANVFGITSSSDLTYTWYKNNSIIENQNTKFLQINYNSINLNEYATFRVEVNFENKKLEDSVNIQRISIDSTQYRITSNAYEVFKYIDKGNPLSVNELKLKLYKNNIPYTENIIPFAKYDNQDVPIEFFNYVIETSELSETKENTENNEIAEIKENYGRIDEEYIILNLEDYYNSLYERTEDNSDYSQLEIWFEEGKERLSTIIIPITYGVSSDLATLSIQAGAISAAVGNSYLNFTEQGLIIKNGEFAIIEGDTPLLSYNRDNGLLVIGNGKFSGEIEASSGKIGGFRITQDKLYSTEKEDNGILPEGAIPNITLNGEKGIIEADTIILGTGAKIKDYIELGNARLQNPDNYDDIFLTVNNNSITLSEDGLLTIGNILLDGANSIIEGNNWSITPEVATFKKINIANGIFEVGKTQTLGGLMVFKSSSRCFLKYEDNFLILELDTNIGLKANSTEEKIENSWIVLFSSEEDKHTEPVKIIEVLSENKYKISSSFLQQGDDISIYDNVIYCCTVVQYINGTTEVQDKNWIGVNSTDTSVNNLHKASLSFSEIIYEKNGDEEKVIFSESPNLIIGNLSKNNEEIYGLYGDYVDLKGSLVTHSNNKEIKGYAGINTLSSIPSAKLINIDSSPIIFWGGANGENLEEIANSPFQVTQNGTIYAAGGLFEGAILTKSIIEGSEIRTAAIKGQILKTEDDGTILRLPSSLDIYDTALGINFLREYEKDESGKMVQVNPIKELTLSSKFFTYFFKDQQSTNFLEFSSYEDKDLFIKANFTSLKIMKQINDNEGIELANNKINYINKRIEDSKEKEIFKNKITFLENSVIFDGAETENCKMVYDDQLFKNNLDFYTANNIDYGGKMQYKKMEDGYDLYIL